MVLVAEAAVTVVLAAEAAVVLVRHRPFEGKENRALSIEVDARALVAHRQHGVLVVAGRGQPAQELRLDVDMAGGTGAASAHRRADR